ncbi:HMG-CoA lyase-like protein [Pseudomonas syringae pv. japonica str. M301072]|uniref:HMG-CoA lyase-like protein n=1 Tax=Pseudomonas syringae pv. japonica str. M301072 TaxID=629262 RepID=F3FGK9_PSESX|nr:HMG-CoA lyase-like protein [Pseudomonas syringae pv. japonica str. M301072]
MMDIILGTYNFPYDSSQRVRDTLERFQLTSEYRAIEVMHQQDKVARLAPRAVLPTTATGLPNSVKGVAL